jgi:hypothetical protein
VRQSTTQEQEHEDQRPENRPDVIAKSSLHTETKIKGIENRKLSTTLGTPNRTTAGAPATVTIENLLSEFHREVLSPAAQRVYMHIWLRMRHRNTGTLFLSDEQLSIRTRILLKHIPAAQAELVRAGLLHLTPCANDTKYEFVVDEDAEAGQ